MYTVLCYTLEYKDLYIGQRDAQVLRLRPNTVRLRAQPFDFFFFFWGGGGVGRKT